MEGVHPVTAIIWSQCCFGHELTKITGKLTSLGLYFIFSSPLLYQLLFPASGLRVTNHLDCKMTWTVKDIFESDMNIEGNSGTEYHM